MPPSVARPAMLALLRSDTLAAHELTERIAVGTRFLEDPAAYHRYVRATYGFYAALEPSLAAAPGIEGALPDLDARRKLHLLDRDLRALGDDGAAIGSLPRCGALPELDAPERAFGCAYVVEGATLGGRYILDRVRRAGTAPEGARAFFGGYGAATGTMWRRFAGALEAFATRHDPDAIVRGARETFAALGAWLVWCNAL